MVWMRVAFIHLTLLDGHNFELKEYLSSREYVVKAQTKRELRSA